MEYILLVTEIAILIVLFLLYQKISRKKDELLLPEIEKKFREGYDKLDEQVKKEFQRNREETGLQQRNLREEVFSSFKKFEDSLFHQFTTFSERLEKLTQMNDKKFEELKEKVEQKLQQLQENNSLKLEEMRVTVDEKLHATLEKRLGESFKLVSDRLEQVHKGLGEMQTLAVGVGDLKKVLTNVKSRGTWGEIQLENLIDQLLTPEQYAKNIATKKGSNDRVEFAIKMPGRGTDKNEVLWLPIDAKFPMEDYQRLQIAQDAVDLAAIEEASKALENRIKGEAKTIFDKYLDPPNTTDFALMFLPVEGLFAEVLRRPGLIEKIQTEYKVVLTGPTTLTAILNSLQMGFRSLVIEKRSSDVWNLLGAVKTEFGKFGDILEKTQKKLAEASNTIDDASKRSRAIERRLRDVQELPQGEQHPPEAGELDE
ncbi:MAG: DNA recombination protein RmuC [Ignavibacteria bacterium]|nr:DNA recombination protein RmuC [Ignavibacteria bacterium]NCS81910.1 DNA recombination protein RmuC [Ignavibacteria bacterium]OIO22637.1 MAG: recombinase RmuC [Ignavibacteria bacterium CG1_02_37_35]